MKRRMMNTWARGVLIVGLVAGAGGCARDHDVGSPTAVTLQTDWFAQPEHGGYYQALAKGYYAEEGLEVTILQGGPNAMTLNKVVTGRADLALNRADAIVRAVDEGMPLLMVMATFQRDPQAVMVHAESPVTGLVELDGRRVVATPGLPWVEVVQRRYGIKMEVLPSDFGMERFLRDRELAQQCLLTNEPYFAREQGVAVRVLPLSASGFDPYHVVYGRRDYVEGNPEVVAAFVRASIRGWRDFMEGDPGPAFAEIKARNKQMTEGFMAYSREAMREHGIVSGEAARGDAVGRLAAPRLRELIEALRELEIVEQPLGVGDVSTSRFLPEGAAPAEGF